MYEWSHDQTADIQGDLNLLQETKTYKCFASQSLVLLFYFRFTVEDSDADGYKYDIGVCVDALSPSPEGVDINGVGVLQIRKDKPDDKPIVIGRYDKADIMAGRMYNLNN